MSTWPTPPGKGLFVDLRMGSLSIGGVDMMTPAWVMLDLFPLWTGADVRGGDREIPGTSGFKPFRRRQTATKFALPMIITGYVDQFDVPFTNPWVGLESNLDYLRTNVVDPPNSNPGTKPSVLTMPSGATRSANIHVERLVEGVQGGPSRQCVLNISIPAGLYV